ncbi:MAG: 3-dehydroquinate synthase, partial [Candidatus Eremiobacteraeota bacterium]|nr:3-dehydroquinate synthase [Candidatus Eremiobacteraeota bacterium]
MSSTIVDGLSYPVIVSDDAAPDVAAAVEHGAPVVVFADARVRARARRIVGALRARGARVLGSLFVRGGERGKSVRGAQSLWQDLLRLGADRSTTLVAVGGGSITDLAGFASATYMRGIAWIAVPTTVLGMADAAIGGKTAIDLPQGKNLAGAFWPPRAVVADLNALRTLAVRERATGIAEIIKAAIIADPGLLDLVERTDVAETDIAAWRELIVRAARVKVGVVAADPQERGVRAALNLGHTIGHAVEHVARGALSHGAAVSVGLRGAGLLAVRLGMFAPSDHARILAALRGAGLPLYWSPPGRGRRPLAKRDEDRVLQTLRRDKKRSGGSVQFVLPERIGEVRYAVAIDVQLVRDAVRQCAKPPQVEETM